MSEEIDPAKLAAEIVNGKHFVYGDDDVVICGWQGEGDPPVAGSTRQKCHICGAQVWVSPNSMNTVLDAVNAKQGAKLFIVCMDHVPPVPPEAEEELLIGEEQKEEMRRYGLDIDELKKQSGKTFLQIYKEAMAHMRARNELYALHRAANPGGCGRVYCRACHQPEPPSAPDTKGYI